MGEIFRKLNLKNQKEILVLNAPETFESELASLDNQVVIRRSIESIQDIEFSLAFVRTQNEVDTLAKSISQKAVRDAIVWFAYPKASSKNYTCDFNRDTGWEIFGELGFKAVRQVAIDIDWSALRFRRIEFVKSRSTSRTPHDKNST